MTTAPLFPAQAKSAFLRQTQKAHWNLRKRLEKKGLPLKFPLSELREHILKEFMGGDYSGAIMCRYCIKLIDITEVAFDHAVPLIRGGALELPNIEAICGPCNRRKGSLLPAEFNALLSFLEREVPLARTDVLRRLESYSKLKAGKMKAELLARKSSPPAKRTKPPLMEAIDASF